MSNPISEEQNTQQPGGAVDKVRKAARQLAYDVRYKVKGQFKDGQKSDAASLKSAYTVSYTHLKLPTILLV